MNFAGGPDTRTDDERRLHRIEELIAKARADEAREAERKAAEERQRAERAAHQRSYSVEDLEREAQRLRASITERESHVRAETEQQLRASRAARLTAEIDVLRQQVATSEAELAALLGKL